MNEHEILINAVELASELASAELRRDWDYRDGEIEIEEDGETRYTEEAQDVFNELYDLYYDQILKCKV
jgi:uncharacterized protein YajQ (UPF0234 family)